MDKFAKAVEAELEPLMGGVVFNAHTDELDTDSLGAVFAVLQFLEKEVEDRKEQIRALLLDVAELEGNPTDKGGQSLKTKYGTATRERRVGKLPQEAMIKELLAQHDVDFADAFSEQRKMVLNPSKLEQLIERGKLDGDDVEDARKVTWALKFKPNHRTAEILEESVPGMHDE